MKFYTEWEHKGEGGKGEMVFKDVEVSPVIDWQEETSDIAMQLRVQKKLVQDLVADTAVLKDEVKKLKWKKFEKFMEAMGNAKKKPKK